MKSAVSLILQNFPLVMLALATLIALAKSENFFNRWVWALFIFPVGLGGIWGFIGHTFYAEAVSAEIGWKTSHFEYEVAIANLAMGIMGIIASFASSGYKKATATLVTIFLLGAAAGHIHEIVYAHNMHPGNSGSILWTDILIPVLVWIAILFSKEKQPNQINWSDH